MAYGEGRHSVLVRRQAVEEKWLMYYSSFHQILLVGEGDFSFALCLANAFGSASNIVASSLDSYDALIINYKHAKSNLESLEKLGAILLHGVDATKMKSHAYLRMRKFDRIIYNFPHAGFYGTEDGVHLVMMHRELVSGFLRNASCMLQPYGEVHVSHKTTPPFCHWNIPELASSNSLTLIDCINFRREDFPGYNNKRGAGSRCDEPFPLGKCSTFKFVLKPPVLQMSEARNLKTTSGITSQHLQRIPIHMPENRSSFDCDSQHLQRIPIHMPENRSSFGWQHPPETTSGITSQHLQRIPIHMPKNRSSFGWQHPPEPESESTSYPVYANNLPVYFLTFILLVTIFYLHVCFLVRPSGI